MIVATGFGLDPYYWAFVVFLVAVGAIAILAVFRWTR